MRLIDADALKNSVKRQTSFVRLIGGDFEEIADVLEKGILQEIENAPTIDAVPVVRCKDCKNSGGKIANRTKCGLHNWWVGFDYFCADGERRE